MEALVTEVAAAPEVWVLESGFIFERGGFVKLKWCIKPAQLPRGSGLARGLDFICVHTPSGEDAEKSCSYDLSIFPSIADCQGAEIVTVASKVSSLSIGELWPDIDKLDEIRHEGTSVVHARDVLVCGRRLTASAEKAGRHSRREGKRPYWRTFQGCLMLNQ
jgi:hypothetical protein